MDMQQKNACSGAGKADVDEIGGDAGVFLFFCDK